MLDDWEITNKLHDLPLKVWDYIKQEKFWGMVIDEKYGGLSFSAYAHSQVILKLATKSMSAALTVMVPNSLGPAEFLSHYGTDKQKDYYLSRIKAYQEYIAQRQKQVEVNSTVESQNKEEESRNVNSTTTTI